jgi:hypothetical protein
MLITRLRSYYYKGADKKKVENEKKVHFFLVGLKSLLSLVYN